MEPNPHLPVPKVYLPFVVGIIAIAVSWVATGDFSRTELSSVLALGLYAAVGYVAPKS